MSKWNETGILRKKQVKDNYDDLLVFGYACKLFRDNEKAIYIDQGKHLIPWMGDEKIKIDRYDGRGALSDLSSCEASQEGYDAMRWLGLSESERKIEQLCDEERYYALNSNEDEDALYKEEERKRLQTNEFPFNYDVQKDPEQENSQDSIPTCEEEVKPFTPPPILDVPADINIPKTIKENARIEKTAIFVHKQGPQMEILIKAKQADNPQFSFMNQTDPLYKYYRHVLSAIKVGRYKPDLCEDNEENKDADCENKEDHYLHPSLAKVQTPPPVCVPKQMPTIPYKPNADCAYTQLITRIQGTHNHAESPPPPPPPPQDSTRNIPFVQMSQEQQQQYYQYYYSMQYYEYYKQIAQQYITEIGCDHQTLMQNPQFQEQIQSQASRYAQVACNNFIQQSSSNPYSQIVSNIAPIKINPETKETPESKSTKTSNPLLSLMHYGSDSDEESEEEQTRPDEKITFKVPPEETCLVIDKMANYVSKNGPDFENIVRAKGDKRFEFLNRDHQFYKYYKHKLDEYKSEGDKPATNAAPAKIVEGKIKEKEKKVIAPVSFSIKKPKEETSKEIKSALPLEESDDEETPADKTSTKYAIESPNILEAPKIVEPPTEVLNKPSTPSQVSMISENNETSEFIKPIEPETFIEDDPILEMIDLTNDLEEKKEAKRAENKIKDKLAMAAKEKLAYKSKDRALQLERRKKAAMFLKMKSAEGESKKLECTDISEEKFIINEDEVLKIDDSESEEGEIKHFKRSKKKKSHKRKSSRSRSRHDSKLRNHKRKKEKRRRRSSSKSSTGSVT